VQQKQSQRKLQLEEKEVKKVVAHQRQLEESGKREASTSATGSDAVTTGTTT
jgi:hypothetical protein